MCVGVCLNNKEGNQHSYRNVLLLDLGKLEAGLYHQYSRDNNRPV